MLHFPGASAPATWRRRIVAVFGNCGRDNAELPRFTARRRDCSQWLRSIADALSLLLILVVFVDVGVRSALHSHRVSSAG